MEAKKEELNDISFEIRFEDLLKFKFSPGDVFYKKEMGRPLLIFKAGQYLDEKGLTRFRSFDQKIVVQKDISETVIHNFEKSFKTILETKKESVRLHERQKVIYYVKNYYYSHYERVSPLSLTIAACNAFYGIHRPLEDYFYKQGLELYERSFFLAGVGVTCALMLGYTEGSFLKDFYNLFYLADINLISLGEIFFKDALNDSRINGINSKTKKFIANAHEQIFETHVNNAYQEIKRLKVIKDPSLINIIDRHHEFCDGSGFPQSLNEESMSDIEALFSFLFNFFEYKAIDYSKIEKNFFKHIFHSGEDNKKICSIRISKMIEHLMEKDFSSKIEDETKSE